MNQATRTRTRRIEKPGGVYLMTAYDFIAMGLIPFISMIFTLSHPNLGYGFVEVFVSLVLCLAVMGASVWALTGDNRLPAPLITQPVAFSLRNSTNKPIVRWYS
jgi:hypothetical protein